MHRHHQVPFIFGHFEERAVPQDSGVVDKDIHGAVVVQSGLNNTLAAFHGAHRVVVGHGFATGGLDLLDYGVGGRAACALSVDGAAQVVDHDLGAAFGQIQGIGAAHAASRARNNRNFSVKSYFTHLEYSL